MKRLRILAAVACAAFILSQGAVLAQFAEQKPVMHGGGFIDLDPLLGFLGPIVSALLQALIPVLVAWAVYRFHLMTGATIDKATSDRFARVLQNEAASLVADGQVKFAGTKVEVDNKKVADVANAVLARMPEAASIGFTPELVAARIIDHIPQVPAAAAIIAGQQSKAAG